MLFTWQFMAYWLICKYGAPQFTGFTLKSAFVGRSTIIDSLMFGQSPDKLICKFPKMVTVFKILQISEVMVAPHRTRQVLLCFILQVALWVPSPVPTLDGARLSNRQGVIPHTLLHAGPLRIKSIGQPSNLF